MGKTAGDLLHKKGHPWQPVRMYKNGVSTGTSESKIHEDSTMMEDMPVKGKTKTMSFANSKRSIGDPKKAKKKLSMSTVGTKAKEPSPKVAKGIPKAPTRKSSRAQRAATYEEVPDVEEEDEDSDEEEREEEQQEEEEQEGLKMKMVVKRTSDGDSTNESWMVSPAKHPTEGDSPRKQYSSRSRTSISQPVTITQSTPTKTTPNKKEQTETSPRKRGRPRKDEESPTPTAGTKRKMDDADSTIGSESGFADSIHESPSQGSPDAKKSKYSMRSGNLDTLDPST